MPALFNKYTPLSWDSVVEQEDAIGILKHDIASKKNGAYLFRGANGRGKSLCSRIYAKETGSLLTVLDATIFGKADDVEEILGQMRIRPLGYPMRTLVVEEAANIWKMAVSAAGEKFLLFLESMPDYLTIIFATTNDERIPDTIKSRCRIIDFNPITTEGIVGRLEYICQQENFKYDKLALSYIAQQAKGSLRYAISSLETISSAGDITMAQATRIASSKYDDLFDFLDAIKENNVGSMVGIVDKQQNIGNFSNALFRFCLGLGIHKKTGDCKLAHIPDVLNDDLAPYYYIGGKLIEPLLNLQSAEKDTLKEVFLATMLLEAQKEEELIPF